MVRLATVDLLLLAGYVLLILVVGFRASRRAGTGSVDFLLAGRTLTLPFFVATLVSTWYGGILGVGEYSYRFGISNWIVFGVPYYLFALVFALFLAKRIRQSEDATIPDRLERVYGRRVAVVGAVLTFLLSTPAAYVLMLGVLIQLLFGWNLTIAIVVATAVTVVYLWKGGFRSDVWVNAAEFILMFVGFGVMVAFAFINFGGIAFIREHVPSLHLTWHGGNTWQFILVWFFIALWTLVDPAFHQRCAAAKDGPTAQRGIVVSILFWFGFDFLTSASGLYARALLPDLEQPMYAYPLLAESVLPPVAKGIFFIGMLATIMSTLSSLMFISGITVGKDIIGRIRNHADESEGLRRWTRYGLAIASVVSITFAVALPSVVSLWYTIGTCVIPGLLLPVLGAYVPRLRVPGPTALAAMVGGWMVSTGSLLTGVMSAVQETPRYWFGIEPMYPGLLVSLAIWSVGMTRVRLITARSPSDHQAKV